MPIVTLLTDFGLSDEYVGVMKGVILSVCPDAVTIDITHAVSPQDTAEGAFYLQAAWPYFPEGTIHTVVVDPGVGSRRAILAVRRQGHIFLAPDNGILTGLLDAGDVEAVRVENRQYFLPDVSRTFHGRDIFAPVAGYLARGLDMTALGPPADPEHLVRLDVPRAVITADGAAEGAVMAMDHFGNLMTSITTDHLKEIGCTGRMEQVRVHVGGHRITGISTRYTDAAPGAPLALIGSRNCLEISVNRGSARDDFGAEKGTPVRVVIT